MLKRTASSVLNWLLILAPNYFISPMRNKLTFCLIVVLSQLLAPVVPLPVFQSSSLLLSVANAESLALLNAAGLGIDLETQGSGYRILIRPKGGVESLNRDLTANVFAVENPSRLVVDIPGFVARGPQKQDVINPDLSALRLGVHKDKTRLVVDINNKLIPEYSVTSDSNLGALIVSFNFDSNTVSDPTSSEPLALATETTNIKMPEPVAVPEEEPSELPPVVIEEPEMPEITIEEPEAVEPEEDPMPLELPQEPQEPTFASVEDVQTPAVSSGFGVVKGVYYQAAKNSKTSSIMVDVDGLNQYSLSQASPGAYELLLRDTTLKGPHLSLPQFPPDTFKGFEVIVASQRGDDVVVKVYTDSGVKLSPFIAQGKLWLRVTQ